MNEARLVKRVKQKGSKEDANELIKLYYNVIYLYVFKQVGEKEQSQDLTQEIFISMLRSISGYEAGKSSFKTWLYKIASNKIIDYYRSKHYRYKSLTLDINDFEFNDSQDIERDFELKEYTKEIINIINRFEGNIQQIIRLKIFSELTFKDISDVIDVKESTVKTKYYGAIKKIKGEMEVCKSNE